MIDPEETAVGLDPDEPMTGEAFVAGLDPDDAAPTPSIPPAETDTAGLRDGLASDGRRARVIGEIKSNPDPAPPPVTEAGLVALQLAKTALDLQAERAYPIVDILPAGFQLPPLIKFIPRVELKEAADKAALYANALEVMGAEGIKQADLALITLRDSIKAMEGNFEEPKKLANEVHKGITGKLSEWAQEPRRIVKVVEARVYEEDRRLKRLEEEERRKAQAEADRKAREEAAAAAKAAAEAKAPEPIVQELKRQAETATAPPVSAGFRAPMTGSVPVKTWKARFAGTPAEQEPNPDIDQLTDAQKVEFFRYLKALLVGQEKSLAALSIDWSYLNKRAAADKSTFAIVGFEAFESGGLRSKGSRGR